MTFYWNIPGFEGLYLDDSWVLSIEQSGDSLRIVIDLALSESHPEYRPPNPGEQYCYRKGSIDFEGIVALSWTGGGRPPTVDPDGEIDFGSIDGFEQHGSKYSISGDFGDIDVDAGSATVHLFKEGPNSR